MQLTFGYTRLTVTVPTETNPGDNRLAPTHPNDHRSQGQAKSELAAYSFGDGRFRLVSNWLGNEIALVKRIF
jgi:hypothetical protein